MTAHRPRSGGRRAAAVVFALFVAGGLLLVFAGTITRSNDIEAEAARARAEVAALEARVAAGEAEIEFFASDAFVQQQARALGFGERGERRFALPADAPSPVPIVPIGSVDQDSASKAPFEAWMELLFGA
jgi:cell division protein FtsB